jgi:NADH-quinone oxidoreductase subunit C
LVATEAADALGARFGDAIRAVTTFRQEISVVVDAQEIVAACTFLRDECHYDYLSDLTAVDWLDRLPRFDVVYHILSMRDWSRLRLKVQVQDGQPAPTVTSVWPAANWPEREVWDLYGIEFAGHPDMRRILMPDGWIGFPLRKDYPQSQITLPRPKTDKT